MRGHAAAKAAKTAEADARSAVSMGLSKKPVSAGQMYGCLPAVAGASFQKGIYLAALPFSDWRSVGPHCGAQQRDSGSLYGAWVSFLPGRSAAKLAAVLSGGKAAVLLDRYVDYGK